LQGHIDDVFSGFTAAARRGIRKGERNDLRVEVSQSRKSVLQFYDLHTQTRRRHGSPPQPLSFFLNIHREIIEPGLGFVVLAHKGSRPAAGAVFFQFGGKAIYKFGASDQSLQEFRGNNLVMSQGIRHLSENHAETLDFGRTSLCNDGLRRFKQSWGATEGESEYFKFDLASETWAAGRDSASGFHTALFSRLPLALNRLAGSILYPHLD
jgi:lipid II:glycine glycyltransferase (peptidoglycan interpeptide bridge formation enzyme)